MEFMEAAALLASGSGSGRDAGGISSSLDPFPKTNSPVWIFGKDYSAIHDQDDLLSLVRSRLWFSYRRDFPEIGSSGFTSDRGWGCMLRCGQMVVAEALARLHLGRDWRWRNEGDEDSSSCDEKYLSIVRLFEDNRSAVYGIHQIALMGEATEGKSVGTWFGPNTVAHVLRKLSAYDGHNNLLIHVAMDNLIIIEEIKELAKDMKDAMKAGEKGEAEEGSQKNTDPKWRPLLLFVPLRLGLTEINPLYLPDLKECLEIVQSVGVIGGRPNHALYFIGYVEDELFHLDPHRTQQAAGASRVTGSCGADVDGEDSPASLAKAAQEEQREIDSTYHIDAPGRLDINQLDPSLALCFFCETEASFDNLCQTLLTRIVLGHSSPLFEICRERPSHMRTPGPSADVWPDEATGWDYEKVNASSTAAARADNSDEEYEIL